VSHHTIQWCNIALSLPAPSCFWTSRRAEMLFA
jgi:hypothetical protein